MNSESSKTLAAWRSYAEEFARLWTSPELDPDVLELAEDQIREVLNQESAMGQLDDLIGETPPDLPWDKNKAEEAAMLFLRAARAEPEMVLRSQLDKDPGESLQSMVEALLGPFDYLYGRRE